MTLPAPAAPPPSQASALVARVGAELDLARRQGPLARIEIPPCPQQLLRLREALRRDHGHEPDLGAIERIAAADVATAATLLRNANSARWRGPGAQPVQSVGQALNRIGSDAAVALLTEVLLKQALPARHPLLARFWEQSALRAAAMAAIAAKLPGTVPELARLFGLFCHVGLPVLLQKMPGYSGTLAEAGARRDLSLVAVENANHRTDHTVVGALVARTWQLAPAVVAAIRLHHEFGAAGTLHGDAEASTLVAMGVLAEAAMRAREGLPPERDTAHQRGAALAWLGLTGDEADDWQDDLRHELDAALETA